MRKDEDFKQSVCSDGSIIYTNLEKVCEGLPEWNDCLWCFICRKPINTMKDIHFFRWEKGTELWFRVFHPECYFPKSGGKVDTPI